MAQLRTACAHRGAVQYTLTLPTVNANTTAETGVLATTVLSGGDGHFNAEMPILAHPVAALPTGIVFSGAYYKASDGKIYFRFGNVTASNYTLADTVAFNILGL